VTHGDLVVKNRYEPATIEQFVKVRLLFLAISHDFAVNCTKLTLSFDYKSVPEVMSAITLAGVPGEREAYETIAISSR
jgi:hypothetical protein